MALVHVEGFDAMLNADVPLCYTVLGSSNSMVAGVIEGNAQNYPNGGGIEFAFTANQEVYFGFHWWPTSGGGTVPNGTFVQFREGTTVHVTLGLNSDGTFTISRNGSIPATSANYGPFLLNVPHWIEIYVKVDNSAGAWEVRVDNGVVAIGPTGSLDTNNAGAVGTCNNVRVIGSSNLVIAVDNAYVATGASPGFLGEGRCVTDLPTADGTNTAWTASASTDVSCVDDATPNSDTDYVSSSTAGHLETFTMATLGVTGVIKAVAIRMFARKDDAAARVINAHIRRASTEYDNATTHALSTSYAGYQGIWETDPNTGVAWVDSNIDGAEYGAKNV